MPPRARRDPEPAGERGEIEDFSETLRQEADKVDTKEAAISLQQEVIRMKQSLADLALTTSHNPVSQNAMSHGDVELF